MSKPIIGITPESEFQPDVARSRGTIKLNWNYTEEIEKAGGVPIIIPPTADSAAIAKLIDGWLVPGGMDIQARHWDESDHDQAVTNDDSRTAAELALFRALPKEVPILGICYGCQLINVAMGGTLEQHIPDRSETPHTGGPLQEYAVTPGSRFAEITQGARVKGESWHHQAVGRIGEGLRVVATHDDDTVEAIESEDGRWIVGVQWHPERTPNAAESKNIFKAFVEAARAYRGNR
ncbi:MAG: gamma-glutamyl-gamma-aminobutyrate hydrolase family protein [Armatimonadetes bacterium]|nr:gamma-glutamyl-gamma-aminobutyrate hydrolase family protein [Armatimonadota bacterium]